MFSLAKLTTLKEIRMWTVFFYNFGFSKDFGSFEDACAYAKSSGFECAVIDPNNQPAKTFRAY